MNLVRATYLPELASTSHAYSFRLLSPHSYKFRDYFKILEGVRAFSHASNHVYQQLKPISPYILKIKRKCIPTPKKVAAAIASSFSSLQKSPLDRGKPDGLLDQYGSFPYPRLTPWSFSGLRSQFLKSRRGTQLRGYYERLDQLSQRHPNEWAFPERISPDPSR